MTARDVALLVCGHARTTEDAALLLTMLGLVDGGRLALPHQPLLEVRDLKAITNTGANGWRGYL